MASNKQPSAPQSLPTSFIEVLDQVEPRPLDNAIASVKKNYAELLSNRIAVWLAAQLRTAGRFPSMLPLSDGRGRETTVASGAAKKPKKTDVRYSTADTGLELLVSVKTLSFRDTHRDRRTGVTTLGRYTKNMVRNDHELRAEAMDLHERFPYAVLVGILFMPFRACEDGNNDKSSFGHAVMTLRPRAGRVKPTDPYQLFERMFIGLYENEPPSRGEIAFFDVTVNPPRKGRPKVGLIDTQELVREIVKTYGIRNRRYMEWADDPVAPLLEQPEPDQDDGEEPEG